MKKLLFQSLARISFLTILLLTSTFGAKADEGVILSLKDGREIAFAFSAKPRLAIGEELRISATDGTCVSYNYADVRHVRYGEIADAGIEKVEHTGSSSDAVFRFNDGQLQVFGLPAGESVSVYDLNGHHVAMQKQAKDGTVLCITLNSRGVLVIRTSNGISYKVSIP